MFTTFLKITSFYKDFLNDYYQSNPHITGKSYDEQYKHLMAEGYGYADYFPRYFEKNYAIKASEVIHNAVHLQKAWASENKSRLTGDELLLEQIKSIQPEVLFIQDSINFDAGFLERIRENVKSVQLLIGHCCAPYTSGNLESFRRYDVMLTCSEKFLKELGLHQVNCYLFPHALERSLVSEISSGTPSENDIVFIGSLFYRNEFHRTRIAYVEEILKSGLPFQMFGIIEEDPWHRLKLKQASYLYVSLAQKMGMKGFQKSRNLRKIAQLKEMPGRERYPSLIRENLRRDMLFGKQMLDEISRHAIGFNLHGEVAGDYAANIRMFEVAGAGTLLVTDHKKNIGELYEPDAEILTYNSPEECIEKLNWAVDHPVEAAQIAAAGQKRTLRDHSVEKRVDLLHDIIKREFSKRQ
ncbi:MAG: glycosyltransferase [Bacteroidota bacterium]